jgi:hypothetical protein
VLVHVGFVVDKVTLGFFSKFFGFPRQYHSTVALQTHITWEMRNMLTEVGVHAWVLDPPHLQEKENRENTILQKKYLALEVV